MAIIIIIIKNEKIRVTLCENAAGALYIVNISNYPPTLGEAEIYSVKQTKLFRKARFPFTLTHRTQRKRLDSLALTGALKGKN